MIRLVLALLLLFACESRESRVLGSPVKSTRDPRPATRDLNVRLESPRQGDVIRENPIVVGGQARTFENNVVIRVRDAEQKLMVETFTTAVGEMGTFSPFEKRVFLTRDPGREITVQALEYSAQDGSVQHLNSVTVSVELRMEKVTLYLPDAKRSPTDCSVVFPEERSIPVSKSMARLLAEILVADPLFPKGSAVRAVNLKDGELTVDFNERLQNVGGSCRALAIRSAVERTLGQLTNVRSVRITAMGDEKTALQP